MPLLDGRTLPIKFFLTGCAPLDCGAAGPCRAAGSCDPVTVSCVAAPAADGTSCNDGNACTAGDACQGGACAAGGPVAVDDGNPCTADACDPATGVTHAAAADGTSCSDGNACTAGDACQSGACAAGAPVAVDDGNACTIDTCDPDGSPRSTPGPAGQPCGVRSLCTDTGHCVELPPAPEEVAPAVDRTVASSLHARTTFLAETADPVQVGLAPGVLVPERTSLLRGRTVAGDGAPLFGATVRVAGRPELGTTVTREDGAFDLAVNGGGAVVLQFERAGYITVQRSVAADWDRAEPVEDVVLLPQDPAVTEVVASAPVVQVAAGSPVTDLDGTRRATLVFQPGTAAEMVFSSGARQPLPLLDVHLTEYSVGPLGPRAMPGELPATSGYTYAVELSAEQADLAGADGVQFSVPVSLYVENFLGFPIGTTVPNGRYDRRTARWIPAENGRVVRIHGVVSGRAELELDGSGSPAGSAALAALGVTDVEGAVLAERYAVGTELWRARVSHWSPTDLNWTRRAERDEPPDDSPEDPDDGSPDDDDSPECGSLIEVNNQILGESLPVAGTPLRLHYRSDRVPGRREAYRLRIPVSSAQPGGATVGYQVNVAVAGQSWWQSLGAGANQTLDYEWNGLDGYGRRLQGRQHARIRIGRRVRSEYAAPPAVAAAFALMGPETSASLGASREDVILWTEHSRALGTLDALALGIGGWTLDAHHVYDRGSGTLYLGDGSRRSARAVAAVIERYAGVSGTSGGLQEGIPRLSAAIEPQAIALGADGTLYVLDARRFVIAVDPKTGLTRRFAGGNTAACDLASRGDGGPATSACIDTLPQELAVEPDGSLLILSLDNLRRVTPDGVIRRVAGQYFSDPNNKPSCAGYPGDGGPASSARLCGAEAVAAGRDGAVYLLETGSTVSDGRLRRIGADGVIRTLAAGVRVGFNGWGGLDVAPDGGIVYSEPLAHVVRRLGPDGRASILAGTYLAAGSSGDDQAATLARLDTPDDVTVASDGPVYVTEAGAHRIRVVSPDGTISSLSAIPPNLGLATGLSGPVRSATLGNLIRTALGPGGALYVAMMPTEKTVARIRPGLPGGVVTANFLLPSADGREVYEFSGEGRHLRTRHALTGGVLWSFEYDDGLLAAAVDGDGNRTTVTRNGSGAPAALVGPYGHTTALEVDTAGYLSAVVDPLGAETRLTYTASGLLTSLRDPRGGTKHYGWDASGRLLRD
ncbi:MAG: hypothetical protein FJ104_04615, partial [Deltaproteobacteria bacterium]|nr:hypothetical protein [Deltaproteobacteria bacterium]